VERQGRQGVSPAGFIKTHATFHLG